MKVNVLLADSAQSDHAGKVHALGIGWTQTTPITSPMAVIALIQFEPGEAASQFECALQLVDEEDRLVEIAISDSAKGHLNLISAIDVELKEGMSSDIPVTAPVVINLGPGIPLEPGKNYAWRAVIDGKTDPAWVARFNTIANSK